MPRSRPLASRAKESKRLKKVRQSLGLTQRELAQEFSVAPGAIAQWETGVRTIPGPVLRLLDLYESGVVKPSQT
jgi:transcriptional regulator with XRE-family HTH domain